MLYSLSRHLSSRHLFDTIFVMLCVIAGAVSHSISNSSKNSPNYKLHERHRLSFMSLLLNENSSELVKPPRTSINVDDVPSVNPLQVQSVPFSKSTVDGRDNLDLCAQLFGAMNGNQIKYCYKHQDILETILPEIMQLTKRECLRITQDLKWNCSAINLFLDRSNAIAFTKEAALIRSILNASMMYLIVKTCSEHTHHSCGCLSGQDYLDTAKSQPKKDPRIAQGTRDSMNDPPLNHLELRRLETGSPLRITRSMIRHQGCVHNILFADALTGVFMDAEDVRSLNKALRIVNDESYGTRIGIALDKRVDPDYKDLSFIKWAKSAISLHNNKVGRQIVREAHTKQCRCHGFSGMCQFQTCSDHLQDFKTIATKLREIYLNNAMQVEVKNLGSHAQPDLYLTRSSIIAQARTPVTTSSVGLIEEPDAPRILTKLDRLKPDYMAYLYESPDYCEAQPFLGQLGTRGRPCFSKNVHNRNHEFSTSRDAESSTLKPHSTDIGPLGSCEYLCCGRGFHTDLALEIVDCNCRFRFCCRVECDQCLRQRMLHFCR